MKPPTIAPNLTKLVNGPMSELDDGPPLDVQAYTLELRYLKDAVRALKVCTDRLVALGDVHFAGKPAYQIGQRALARLERASLKGKK